MSQLFVKWKQIMSRVSWAQTPREACDSRKWVTRTHWDHTGALWKYIHKLINCKPNQAEAELPFHMAGGFSCHGPGSHSGFAAASAAAVSCVLPHTKEHRSLGQQTAHQHMLCKSQPLKTLSLYRGIFSESSLNNRSLQLPRGLLLYKIQRVQCLQGRSSWVCTWVAVTVGNTVRLRHKLELYDKKGFISQPFQQFSLKHFCSWNPGRCFHL